MLRSVSGIKKEKGSPRHLWFTDSYFDLFVWLDEEDQIMRFQLTYAKNRDEHSLTWKRESGYVHDRIDDGEERPGRYKGSPILVADGAFDYRAVVERFKQESAKIERRIATFVIDKLLQYPRQEK
jgi:hypothetical protein